MALINKTGISNGNTIQAEHITRVIDALSGASTDTVQASGSFSGSFQGDGSQLTGITGEWDGSLIGDALIVGKLSVTAGVTASLQGTASWANNAISSSYVPNQIAYSGSANYVTKFSSSAKLSNSIIYDNGTEVIIGTTGGAASKLYVYENRNSYYGINAFHNASGGAAGLFTKFGTGDILVLQNSNSNAFTVDVNGTTFISSSLNVRTSITASNITGSFVGDGSQLTGIITAQTASYVLNAISSSFATSASRAVTAASATTASYLQNAVIHTGNRFGTNMIVGPDDAYDLQLQASASTYLTIEGGSSTYRGNVRLANSGSPSYPALTFASNVISGIGYHDGGDPDSGDGISLSDSGYECASFQQGQAGVITGYPVITFGERKFFKVNDKWGQPGIHLQKGTIYADGFASNHFYSGLYSDWVKKNYDAGFSVSCTSSITFYSVATSSFTGSASTGNSLNWPQSFLEVDPNYNSGGYTYPNVTITNRLSIGTLWGGTGTAIGRDATSGEIRATSSDQRLKTNIQTISGSLDIINALNGVQYEWTSENEPEFKISAEATGSQIGLVAQQVQAVLPQVVKQSGFKDYLTIEYDKLVAVLIEGIKSQQQEIDTLKTELAAIKNHLGI